MKKEKCIRKRLLLITLTVACFAFLAAGCKAMIGEKPIPLTDLAATFDGEKTDADGRLLAPFDVAYAEAFESGDYEYDKTALLLKMQTGFNGKLTRDLKKCGFTAIEKFASTSGGEWYRATVNSDTDVKVAIKKARSLKDVKTADFDYIYRTDVTADDISAAANGTTTNGDVDGIIDDVLQNLQVKDQWHLTSSEIQRSWRFLKNNGISAGGSNSVVVAVIDTGVDYNHPDLKANMWTNTAEIPGDGIDNDSNGYIDDVYGCSTVSDKRFHSGDPMDDHGHGTHVAGIIAAANNKEGIVGVAYNVKIMAVKAGQSTGVFTQSDIAEAVLYAYANGADVINMSFGGTACSIAVQDALETAYTRSVLVASAGNDGMPDEATTNYNIPRVNYPAALSYVIGVMSVNELGVESSFTNWDVKAFNSVEYEVYAPGERILSTLPDGKYGRLSGTSMAAPIVSSAAALLRSYYTDRDKYPTKFISAQLCATSELTAHCYNPKDHGDHNLPMRLNMYDALTKLPKPDVNLYGYYLFDSENIADGNNGDGVIDAGETVNIGTILRNRWGMSKNTVVKIDTLSSAGIANPYVEIISGSVDFGGVGTYSTKDNLTRNELGAYTGVENPIAVKISKDCPNDYIIELNVTITCNNALGEKDSAVYETNGVISFTVRNGFVLPSQITEDMTLTKDNYYIIPNSTVIAAGVTVTVEPGTKIQFWTSNPEDPYSEQYKAYLQVKGKFIANGTVNEPIELFPCELMAEYEVFLGESENGKIELNYTKVTNATLFISSANYCTFTQNFDKPLYTRYLEPGNTTIVNHYVEFDGVPRTAYFGSYFRPFKIAQATNCLFYKYGNSSSANNRSYIPTLYGIYSRCAFINCRLDFTTTVIPKNNNCLKYENCVFSGNTIQQQASSSSWGQCFENQEKDYYDYVDISYPVENVTSFNNKTYFIYNNLAPLYWALSINGNLCCIETPEELSFIQSDNKNIGIHVGFKVNADCWINGEPLGDFLAIDNRSGDCYASLSNDNFLSFVNSSAGYLFEIPNHADGNSWTQEEIESLFKKHIRTKSYINELFKNNVILNDLSDSNPEHWLRFRASEGNENQIIGFSGNYWGTTDKELIERQIIDYDVYRTLKDIVVGNYLTTPPENTFPFVYDAYVLDSSGNRTGTVGNETITFVAEFNRDMDTSVPLSFRFGSTAPYADYKVDGNFVSARRWEGTYTLKTTAANGIQYMNIANGRAADDNFLTLCNSLRYTFEIDTTAAQAMIMQGEATETGIKLTWQQDDFDTLLGYNIYRSDKKDGYYTRLNNVIIPYDTTEFFDDTVEPGKIYYYNFTVVKTDLTESTPSGKINLMSMDTMAPNIYHSPVRTAYTGNNLVIAATITDNLQVTSAKIYYRVKGAESWKTATMSAVNTRFTGIIPAADIDAAVTDGLEYYIEASDSVSYTYKGAQDNAYEIIVKLAVDKNSLGDVDGDGVITSADALMILQAINGKINLDDEQFLRADINGDKTLSSSEALAILQYVSGKITSITAVNIPKEA